MKQFFQEIFNKAKEESGEKSLKKWAEHISDYLMEEKRFQISSKTLERYYNGETSPNGEKKNQLASYIGYDSYKEFLLAQDNNDKDEISDQLPRVGIMKRKTKKKVLTAILILCPVLFGAGYFGFSAGREECMIWMEDHFEASACAGMDLEEERNEYRLENFRKIEVSRETNFFAADGSPKIWYDKHHNVITYFTAPGINPETNQTVKSITTYMIEKYVHKKD